MAAAVDEHVWGRPCPALRDTVWRYSGYRQHGVAPALHRGLPSPFLTLILTLDEPLTIERHVDPHEAPGSYDTLLGGLHTSPALIRHDGFQSGVQVHLSPWGARRLLGLPAGELAGMDLPADTVLGRAVDRAREAMLAARDWPGRFAAVERTLIGCLRDAPDPAPEARFAWSTLLRRGGAVAVASLAREVGWSERHLANQMRQETGLTPKLAARVIRFDRARRRLADGQSIALVAATCGYADQSHLTRDFVALAGCPPATWLASEFGNVQAADAARGASSLT